MAGRKFQIGNVSLYIVKRIIFICVCGRHKNWLERNTVLIRCGKYSTKKSIWENQHLSSINLGCTQRQCQISKDIVDNYRTMFKSRSSAEELKNFHTPRIFVFLHGFMIWKVMRRNVWSENGVSKQDDSKTLKKIYSVHR